MAAVVNTQQEQAWNGYEGRHWADHPERYDAVNSGFNGALVDAAGIADADHVLDIGCGTGQTTRLAGRRASKGRALGVDLSAPMLERARTLTQEEGLTNVAFERGDAQVHPLPPGGFDAAISRFGVMFFADPIAGFANIGNALRPGGRIAFLAMGHVEGTAIGTVLGALEGHVRPGGSEAQDTGPTSLAEPERIREVLGSAGFRHVAPVHVEATQVWGRDAADAAGFLADWGPVRHLLGQVGPAEARRARSALETAMRDYEQDGAVRMVAPAWLVNATWPG